MEIYSSTIHAAQGINGPHRTASTGMTAPTKDITLADEFTFSKAGQTASLDSIASGESSSSGIRFDLVNRIKKEIAAGTYDSADKMDIAMDRLLSRMNPR